MLNTENSETYLMERLEEISGLFGAIERLSSEDISGEANSEIRVLASIGRKFADVAHNEIEANPSL